jgi:hypothetical protein
MTTPTAVRPNTERAFFASNLAPSTYKGNPIRYRDDGSAMIEGVKIFRAGTFRDSIGEQRTWSQEHLQMMVGHFEFLRKQQIFMDVPVRRDHSATVDKVMGYIDSLRVEGDQLVADFAITEPDDVDKLGRGTYRNVSLEVGMYVANDEAAYWPVVFGVAYVDIPAVEGLHSKEASVERAYFSQVVDPSSKENSVSTKKNSGTVDAADLPSDVGATAPAAHASENVAEPAAAPAAPVAMFRVRGVETSDFAAVQRHIDTLEKFVEDSVETARRDFVTSLVSENKIAAPQQEPMEQLVLALNEEQFEAFKASYAAAPALALLASHGSGNPDLVGETNPAAQEIEDLEEQIAMHRRAGLSEEKIANTKAAKRLAELTKN